VTEITLVLVLLVFFVKIRDRGGVVGNDGVGISSKVLDIFDAWVEAFESTIELCIGGEVGEGTYDEE
jgi:hypothetical protein